MRKRSWIVVAGAGAVALALSPADAQTRYASSDVRIRTSKEPVVSRIERVDVKGRDTTLVFRQPDPTPPFRIEDYTGLSEPQITNYIATRDSAHIGLARLAQQRATNPAVRDLAVQIEQMRAAELDKNYEIITDEDVGVEARQGDYALTRLVEVIGSLNQMPAGPQWDLAFLRTEFFLHENDLQVMRTNLPNAHDNDLEYHMKESFQRATNTRDAARSLAASLGMSLP